MTLEYRSAMPEFLGVRNDVGNGSWDVENGLAARGEAWTDLEARRMRVPLGGDKFARVIRAHEMMHAQVSPSSGREAVDHLAATLSVSPMAVLMAEEFRVNTLCSRSGFNMDDLCDGSERKSGERYAERKDWAGGVAFLAALAGTKAAKDYILGVRKINPQWAKAFVKINRELVKAAKAINTRALGQTSIHYETTNIPNGFMRHTGTFARIIDAAIRAGEQTLDEDSDDNGDLNEKVDLKRVTDAIDSLTGKAGVFATMVLDEKVALTRHVSGNLGRKRIATNIGRNPRRINRVLTDPERRIFDRTTRGQGGIILIDQSGSMSLSDDDIWQIVNAAPGCVIIGYSHRSHTTAAPNVWVLAERGRVCEEVREGNGGNGVDGPALRFALSKRKHGEPIIWVCDGMVTSGNGDDWYDNLGNECLELVLKHGVHMVPTVSEAKDTIEALKAGAKLYPHATGPMRHLPMWTEYVEMHPEHKRSLVAPDDL